MASEDTATQAASSNTKYLIAAIVAAVAVAGLGYSVTRSTTSKTPKPLKPKRLNDNAKDASIDKSVEKQTTDSSSAKQDEQVSQQEQTPTSAPSSPISGGDASKLSPAERNNLGKDAKARGNALYQERKFDEAIQAYTEAIKYSPNDAIYYSNRAACYANLGKYEDCIEDCNQALKINPSYMKALNRRAQAYEKNKDNYRALVDYTAMCIMEEFKVDSTVQATDRVLKEVAHEQVQEAVKAKEENRELPSPVFITAYLESFRSTYTTEGMAMDAPGDASLKQAIEQIQDKNYPASMEAVEKALSEGVSPSNESTAKNMLGTYKFLIGDVDGAISLLDESLVSDPNNINSIIKLAGCHMEKGDVARALDQFDHAIEKSPDNPDIYYHRGQVKFLLGDHDTALTDYKKALELDPDFVFNHIQIAVLEYRMGNIEAATRTFEETLKKYPNSPDVRNYYGEILLDLQRFDEASKMFDKTIKLRPVSPLAYMNKAFLHLSKGELGSAEKCCQRATEVDPKCDLAYSQWAQILMQQNKIDEAMAQFDKAIALSRTEPELLQIMMFKTAANAQKDVLKGWPFLALRMKR